MNNGLPRFATVLVVEDDECARSALESILTAEGHFVVGAANGAAALESLHVLTPDAVITDVQMPELDGIQLCRAIRASPLLRRLPIIVISSETRDQFGASGLFDIYLRKPIDARRLIYALSRVLALDCANDAAPSPAQSVHDVTKHGASPGATSPA